jgi:hypothetical protein
LPYHHSGLIQVTQLTTASGMAFDLHTDAAYTDGTTIVGDVLNLVQIELESSLDPIATARSSASLASGTSNSDAQGNSDNADGGSTAADQAEAVDQQLGWQWDGSIAGQVSVWGHVVVPAPAVVARTARPRPSLLASTLQLTHADLNMLALRSELLSVQAGPTPVSTVP